jgi:TonB family protein
MGLESRAAGILALVLALSAFGAATAAPPRAITRPDWARIPNAEEMAAHYPQRAKDEQVSGKVRIKCSVKADGFLTKCKALEESPKGYGFAEAALALSSSFLMKPKTIDGQAVDGGEVTVPLVFAVPEDRLGDGAVVLTRVGAADAASGQGPVVPCPDAAGDCQIHLVTWRQQPPAQQSRKILGANIPTVGVTFALCTIGADGALQGCSLKGDQLSPAARTAVEATLPLLKAAEKTEDGLETALKTIAVPFIWEQIAPAMARRR